MWYFSMQPRDESGDGVQRDPPALQRADVQVGDAGRVDVGVHQARQDQAPRHVIDLGGGSDVGGRGGGVAGEDDPAVLHRQGLDRAAHAVLGPDPAVGDDKIGGRRRRGGGVGGQDERAQGGQDRPNRFIMTPPAKVVAPPRPCQMCRARRRSRKGEAGDTPMAVLGRTP